jgi:hypothetical protein
MDTEIRARLFEALVGKPMVSNAFRGTLVEAILAGELEPEWRWCADGWGSYDFEGPGALGLEVKQSAARQDWHDESSSPSKGRFDIAARTGRWAGAEWIVEPGRAAAIYVFAWHPVFDPLVADHREPSQWQFHVVAASNLPLQNSLGLTGVQALAPAVGISDVRRAVFELWQNLPS